jgi:hypothetical protein
MYVTVAFAIGFDPHPILIKKLVLKEVEKDVQNLEIYKYCDSKI